MPVFRYPGGFTLMELLIGIFLSTLLMTGIVQLLTGSVAAYRLQLAQSQMEDSARFARDVLIAHISQAGYQPKPWQFLSPSAALTDDAMNGEKFPGDQLGLQRWSDQNCFGHENSARDDEGQPEFYLLQSRFLVNSSRNLAWTCRYGPDAGSLITQIRNHGLVENVESMQVLYAEDRNGDHITDHWVTAGAWKHESEVRAVKIALLLSTQQAFDKAVGKEIVLLDQLVTTPADGHLRKVFSQITAIRGRL